jgi:hypothetical protein
MAIRWNCPTCNKKLSIATRKAGCEVRCPACNEFFIVPAQTETVAPPLQAPSSSEQSVAAISETPTAGSDFCTLPKNKPMVTLTAPAIAKPAPGPFAAKLTGRQLLVTGAGMGLLLVAATAFGIAWLSASAPDRAANEPVAAAPVERAPARAAPEEASVDVPAAVVPAYPPAAQGQAEPAPAPAPVKIDNPAPALPAAAKEEPAEGHRELVGPEPTRMRRHARPTAEDLRDELREVPELDFSPQIDKLRRDAWAKGNPAMKGPGAGVAPNPGVGGIRIGGGLGAFGGIAGGANGAAMQADHMLQPLTTSPPEFAANVNHVALKQARAAGLAVRTDGSRTDLMVAKDMDVISTTMRNILVTGQPGGGPGNRLVLKAGGPMAPKQVKSDRHEEVEEWCKKTNVQKYPGGVATLSQMLQVEEDSVRLVLVGQLAKVDTRESSNLLARRAMFDLSSEVRLAAVNALKKRRADSYRGMLLAGMRYPWPPAADHAAEALIEVQDKGSVPALIALLDKPDPTLPELDSVSNTHKVRELVKINHMRNCYLCHAASSSPKDLVRGLTPKVGGPVMTLYPTKCACGDFVSAQVTYLRQDFSVIQPVANSAPWPEEQRYDYVVRTRKATADELQAAKERIDDSYPQRDAVLKALRGLTGRDAGTTAEDWKKDMDEAKQKLPAPPGAP